MRVLENDRLLRAINREPLDRTPIWLMRQAGRYLPEYRALRAKVGSFMRLCQTPELAAEVTLQPITRFPLDAAILFSDILTIPDAMGMELDFQETVGPYFQKTLKTEHEISSVSLPDLNLLNYVYDTIRLVKKELAQKIPLIGFCGSPFTLGAYMLEGRGKTGFPIIQKMLVESPDIVKKLLDLLAHATAQHLNEQIGAGVDAVMIFDTWGGLLSSSDYQTFSLSYIKTAITQLKASNYYNRRDQFDGHNESKVPIILFTRNGGAWLELMAETGCHVIGIDWETSLTDARKRVGQRVALQGNLNPEILKTEPNMIRENVKNVLAAFGAGSGHIFNLGHGVTPDVPPEHVGILIDTVHEESRQYHQANDQANYGKAL